MNILMSHWAMLSLVGHGNISKHNNLWFTHRSAITSVTLQKISFLNGFLDLCSYSLFHYRHIFPDSTNFTQPRCSHNSVHLFHLFSPEKKRAAPFWFFSCGKKNTGGSVLRDGRWGLDKSVHCFSKNLPKNIITKYQKPPRHCHKISPYIT